MTMHASRDFDDMVRVLTAKTRNFDSRSPDFELLLPWFYEYLKKSPADSILFCRVTGYSEPHQQQQE